jgi:glycine/D-amino acid oxidase-like deaminating enzyme
MTTPTWERRPYWHATMPPIPRADGRPLPERADVVVIGGGYTGLVAALMLTRGGARVTLLEKEGLGFGASSRNGGLLHPGLKWGRASLERSHGPELGRAIFQAGIDATFTAERFIAQEGFAADYRRSGLAVLAWSARHLGALEEELAELRDGGLTGRMVRGAETREELGSDFYPGGYVVEEAGMLHPGRYVAALAAAAAEAGTDLHTGLPALRVDRDGADRVVVTAQGSIRAGAVLLATNGYTDGAAPWVRQRVMPIGSYIIATEPMGEELAASVSPRGRTFFDSKAFLYYWHVNAERRLIFGGRASFRRTTADRTAAILARAMVAVHPQAAGLRIDYAWGGNVAFTFDRLPHLGEHDGLHYAVGYCGSGVALGTSFGLTMAERLGGRADVARELSPFERTPFPGAPFVPAAYRGRPWFLPLAGEWFRLTDHLARRRT